MQRYAHRGKATYEVMGLTAMLRGALLVAEALAPAADQAVTEFGGERFQTGLTSCYKCYGSRLVDLVERKAQAEEVLPT